VERSGGVLGGVDLDLQWWFQVMFGSLKSQGKDWQRGRGPQLTIGEGSRALFDGESIEEH